MFCHHRQVSQSQEGRGTKGDKCMFLLYIDASSITNDKGRGGGAESTSIGIEFSLKDYYGIQVRLSGAPVCIYTHGDSFVKWHSENTETHNIIQDRFCFMAIVYGFLGEGFPTLIPHFILLSFTSENIKKFLLNPQMSRQCTQPRKCVSITLLRHTHLGRKSKLSLTCSVFWWGHSVLPSMVTRW